MTDIHDPAFEANLTNIVVRAILAAEDFGSGARGVSEYLNRIDDRWRDAVVRRFFVREFSDGWKIDWTAPPAGVPFPHARSGLIEVPRSDLPRIRVLADQR